MWSKHVVDISLLRDKSRLSSDLVAEEVDQKIHGTDGNKRGVGWIFHR